MTFIPFSVLPVEYGYALGVESTGDNDDAEVLWGRANAILGFASTLCIGRIFDVSHVWETAGVEQWIAQEASSLRVRIARSSSSAFKRVLLGVMLDEVLVSATSKTEKNEYLDALRQSAASELSPPDILAALAAACFFYRQFDGAETAVLASFMRRVGVQDVQVLNEAMAVMSMQVGLADQAQKYAELALAPSGRIEDAIFGHAVFREITPPVSADPAPGRASLRSSISEFFLTVLGALRNQVPLKVLSKLPPNVIYMGKDQSGSHLFFVNGTFRRLKKIGWLRQSSHLIARLDATPGSYRAE